MSDKLWGGRFAGQASAYLERFGASLPVDVRLAPYDLRGSLAHVRMLRRQGIIPADAAAVIERGLTEMLAEVEAALAGEAPAVRAAAAPALSGPSDATPASPVDPFGWGWQLADEDVHMAIERTLRERIGDAAGWLHTARSRNDQVALDLHLYAGDAARQLRAALHDLQDALLQQAEASPDTVLPGYTHLQRAQPVLLAHHLLAYVEMLERDRERLALAADRSARSPLGAGALAGAGFDVDPASVAAELCGEATRIYANSLDAVADRDFAVELIAAAALVMVHLSRLAEEWVLWCSAEFGFLSLDDAVSSGSSMMPQKKNPDPAELVRGKAGRVFGDLQALLTVLKGLPLAYNKDLQEDKQALFDAVDSAQACTRAMAVFVRGAHPNPERMAAAAQGDGGLLATELADYLVEHGLPFRDAHRVVGALVARLEEDGRALAAATLHDLREASPLFGDDAVSWLDVGHALARRRAPMGTAPMRVRAALSAARQRWRLTATTGPSATTPTSTTPVAATAPPWSLRAMDHVQLAAPPGCEAQARAFFGRVLGLPEVQKPEPLRARGGVWFQCGQQQLHLGVEAAFAPARKAHPAFCVADLAALRRRLREHGIAYRDDDALPGVDRFYCEDPFGNRLEFMAEG